MNRVSGAIRWLSRYGHRLPAVTAQAIGAVRKGGLDGLSTWWRRKNAEFEHWHAETAQQLSYEEWLAERRAARPRRDQAAERGLFSILTSAYDTPAELLEAAAASVSAQTFADFEWVLVDNGSTREETRRVLDAIAAREKRVRLVREEKNLGPLGGMRRALESAQGAYVVPFDSDDLLEKDALGVLAHAIETGGRPSFLYSDEEVLDGARRAPFLRTSWDPVQVFSNSHIFHLCAIARESARTLGVYSDDGASWCHDWDTALRVLRGGVSVRHVPEVLYSWRVHAGSSTNKVAPDRTNSLGSQRHVLEEHLRALGLADRFEVAPSPIDRGAPEFHFRRLPVAPRPVFLGALGGEPTARLAGGYPVAKSAAVRSRDDLRALGRAAHEAGAWLALVGASLEPRSDEWLWHALGLRELAPDAAVIGGRILDAAGRVREGAGHFGFDGLAGSPEAGHDERDPGYFSTLLKQRSASTVPASLCTFDPALLDAAQETSLALLGAWLGAAAAKSGRRVVFSPFLAATTRDEAAPAPSAEEVAAFRAAHGDLLPDERFYPVAFGLERATAFQLARRAGART